MSKSIVLIGARGNSKRVPKKNLQLINGSHLIDFSIYAGLSLKLPVYLSSDSEEILARGKKLGINTIERPKKLASDDSTDYDWIFHSVDKIERKFFPKTIIFLRPTTPFRNTKILSKAISTFNSKKFDSLRSIESIPEAIEKFYKIDKDKLTTISPLIKLEDTNKPSHFFEASYKPNGYIDIIQTTNMLKNRDIYGKNIQAFITPKSIEIDTLEDLEYARYSYSKEITRRSNSNLSYYEYNGSDNGKTNNS